MKLEQVQQFKECTIEDVNTFLQQNFVTMKVVKIKGADEEKIVYILGK